MRTVMKPYAFAALLVGAGLTMTPIMNQQVVRDTRPVNSILASRVQMNTRVVATTLRPRDAESLRPPAAASHDINWVQCPQEAQDLGAMCGRLPVPLDRRDPGGKKMTIYFEIYSHTNPGPAESAFFASCGGPGNSITVVRGAAVQIFGPNLDVHDIVLIDSRGCGRSTPIDCPELQNGTASFDRAERDCASQLGDAASDYGTGDTALDTEAVRTALGYDKIDYWGGSYGGEPVVAYATRFGQHLRSIVLDAAEGTPALRAFLLDSN